MNLKEAYELEIARYVTIKRKFFELQKHIEQLKKETKTVIKGTKQLEQLLAYKTYIDKEE